VKRRSLTLPVREGKSCSVKKNLKARTSREFSLSSMRGSHRPEIEGEEALRDLSGTQANRLQERACEEKYDVPRCHRAQEGKKNFATIDKGKNSAIIEPLLG